MEEKMETTNYCKQGSSGALESVLVRGPFGETMG